MTYYVIKVSYTHSQEGEEEEAAHMGRTAVLAGLQGQLCHRCLQRPLRILADHSLVELTGVVVHHPAGIPDLYIHR